MVPHRDDDAKPLSNVRNPQVANVFHIRSVLLLGVDGLVGDVPIL